jgi:hypothetical protein
VDVHSEQQQHDDEQDRDLHEVARALAHDAFG